MEFEHVYRGRITVLFSSTSEHAAFPNKVATSGLCPAIITWETGVFRAVLNSQILQKHHSGGCNCVQISEFYTLWKAAQVNLFGKNSCCIFNALLSKVKSRALHKNGAEDTCHKWSLKEYQMIAKVLTSSKKPLKIHGCCQNLGKDLHAYAELNI